MLRLTREQGALLAEKLSDAANVAAGAMIFGQFLSERPFSLALAAVGFMAWAALMAWALLLARGE